MPLVRRSPEPTGAPAGATADELRSPDPARRRAAARALAGVDAVPALAAALGTEADPAVRAALLDSLSAVGGEAVALALLPFLRSEDAGLRNGALEALRGDPAALAPHLPGVLADPDPDLRILAAELARGLAPDLATRLLCRMLEAESHPNACAAALDVLAEVGTPEALPLVQAMAARFAGDPFVPFAARVAAARIGSAPGQG